MKKHKNYINFRQSGIFSLATLMLLLVLTISATETGRVNPGASPEVGPFVGEKATVVVDREGYGTAMFLDGGAYTLNYAAADPSIYLPPIPLPEDFGFSPSVLTGDPVPGGRGDGSILIPLADFNDGTSDVKVESLAPQDMALGQVVPYETEISVSGDITPENGVITFVIGWNTLTTNGDDFGFDARPDDFGYGVIEGFIDTSDGAHFDPGGDAQVDGFTWSLINDEIVGIFTVSGLDDGDFVVLESWLVLDETIPAGVGGNVQTRLIDAATGPDQTINVANSGAITLVNGDAISTGNQTVPLLKPSGFFNADVDLSVTKTDDVDPIDVDGTLTYTITASNAGPSVANTVVVYDELDPNVTFVSASDGGFINTDTGDAIPDGAVQWNVGALAPGNTVQYTVAVTVNSDAPTDSPTGEDLVNTVTVTTISDDTDLTNNIATELTDVNATIVNALPEAVADVNSTIEEQPVSGDVLTNDDQGDAPATVTSYTQPSNGSVVVNPDGTYTYTPDAGFVGTDTFEYTITDDNGDTSTALVTITVTDEGTPVAVDDVNSTDEDTPVDGSAFDNDSLIDDATLDSYDATSANGGTVVMNPDGTYTYTPASGFSGTDTFTYTICDDDTPTPECSTATVTIDVNALPEAVADVNSTIEEQPVSGDVLTNDDQGDAPATVTSYTQPSNGSVVVNPDGTYIYTPDAGFVGTDTFEYTITDDNGDTSTALVTITVTDEGTPVAVDDVNSTDEDTPVDGSAFDNDSLIDDATLDSYDATSANGGTVVMNPDGTYTYTPASGFSGTDTFTYTICDDDTPTPECSTATVTIDVNALPEAVADVNSTIEEQPVSGDVLTNDDQGDAPATVTSYTQPSNGSVVVNPDGTYTYTPDAGFVGTDTFEYTITDDNGDTSTALVTITVTDEGTPVAVDDVNSTDEDTPVDGSAFDNDSLIDDATLDSYDATSANGGTVVMNPDGTYTYTPVSGFSGTDTFTYTICDDDTPTPECSTATVTIDVNALPEAVADVNSTIEEQPVSGNVLTNDDQGDAPATVTSYTQPSNGSVVVNPDGTYTYTPDAGFVGTDTFEYTITDDNGDTSTALVTITVTDEGTPVAVDDVNSTDEDTPVDGSAFDNDSLIDDATLDSYDATSANGGTVVMNPDGTYTYTPASGFSGTDTFTYTICDDDTPTPECSTATVTIDVNALPEAVADVNSTIEEQPVSGDVLTNDDQGDAPATVTSYTQPSNGSVVVNPDGTYIYTPDAGFVGTDTFEYTITDDNGDTSTALVTITVTDEGTPVAVDDVNSTDEDTPVDGSAFDNDSLIDDATLDSYDATSANGGTVVMNPDGTYTYTPASGFSGTDTFTYTICDDDTPTPECSTATVTIDVNALPEAVADVNSTIEEQPVSGDVLTNDDQGDAPATVTSYTQPSNGSVVVNPDGTYTYTPDAGFVGTDTFEYTITDDNGDTSTALVTITVTDEGTPVAVDDVNSTDEDTPVDGSAFDNDSLIDDATLDSYDATSANGGTVVMNPDGTYTYTPASGFSGTDTFTYTICDDDTPTPECSTATVTIDVNALPEAVADVNSTIEEQPVSGNVLTNDDQGDAPATVTSYTQPSNGSVVVNPDGTYTYTPDAGFVGTDTFEYTITDDNGDTSTALVTITVTDEGTPVAVDDTNTTLVDTPVDGNWALNDDFTDDATLNSYTQPANGSVVVNADGTYTYTPDEGFNGDDSFTYTICDDDTPTAECSTATVSIFVQNPVISIIKTSTFNDENGDGFADVGETISYSFTVANEGNVSLTDVTVTDPLITVNGGPIDLGVGAFDNTTFSGTYTIDQADIDQGGVNNQATATGTDPNGDPVSDLSDDNSVLEDDQTVTTLPQNPAISIIKTSTFNDENGDGFADVGETISYSFTVANEGNVSLTDVTVTDPLITVNGGPIDLGVGAFDNTTFSGTYTIDQADIDQGGVNNQATATGTDPNGDPVSDLSDDNSVLEDDQTVTTLPQNPAISSIKTSTFNDENGDGFAGVGETISYNFTVANEGNVSLTDVTVTDPLITVNGGPIDLGVGAFDNTTFSGTYTIDQADIDQGGVNNQATATGTDPNGDPVSDLSDDNSVLEDDQTVTTLPQNPAISIIKTSTFNDENGDGFADVGETISYSFTVANEGNVSLTDVTVTDPLITVNGGPIDLGVGAFDNTTFSGTYTIDQADIDQGGVNNQATATGTDPNGDPVSDLSDDNSVLEDDQTVTTLPQNPAISIIKTSTFNDENGDGFADVGETISYSFTVANEGNVSLTDVTVTDPLITVNGGPIDLGVGAFDNTTFSGTYTIDQADIDQGGVNNQATATGTDPNGDPVSDLSDDNSVLEDDQTVTTLPQNPAISIIKTSTFNDENGDGFAGVGETISYNFTVANEGNVSLTDVTVTDPLITVNGGPIDLGVGAFDNTTFSGTYTIDQADIDQGGVNNQATATGTDPNGDPVSDLSDDNSVLEDDQTVTTLPQNPAISIIKTSTFNDENGDGFADVGETISYSFTVANEGNVSLTDVTVTDPLITVNGGPIDLGVGAFDNTTFSGTYTIDQADIDQGGVNNQATATGTDPNGDPVSDLSDDNSVLEDDQTVTTLPQNPAISIVKTFADDEVIAGGDGSSFTLVVTNEGNVTLSDALIKDEVDIRLTVMGVSGTAGNDADSDGDVQTVEWYISSLAPGASETITVDFTVEASVEEANGVGELNNAANVPNSVTVGAEAPQGDPDDPNDDITDGSQDYIDILVDINLSIVKTFDPTDAPQGTYQSFTIEVSNAGPSDAVDVAVTDAVHTSLEVIGVSHDAAVGDCTESAAQDVDCTVNIPAGETITVTVDYLTAPFLDDGPSPYGTGVGDDFYFVFLNGSILEGSTDGGPVYLDGVDITADVSIITSLTRNEIVFDPPGPDPAFELHLSCSDPFTDGWGQSGGPVRGVDVNWQIASFTVARYSPQGYLKSCGNVVNDFDVPNTAEVSGDDSFGTQSVSDDATVTVGSGITIDKLTTKGKRLTARLTNLTGEDKEIAEITLDWPETNGSLKKVWLTYGNTNDVIWQGVDDPTDAFLNASDPGWNGATLFTNEAILRFDFQNKVDDCPYTIRVWFTDGTWLDLHVSETQCGGAARSALPQQDNVNRAVIPEQESAPRLDAGIWAFPNPSRTDVTIEFTVPETTEAILEVFDINGVRVATLFDGQAEADIQYQVTLQKGLVPYGTYVYRLTTETNFYQGRVLLLD